VLFNEDKADRIQDATRYRRHAKRVSVTMYETELDPLINEVLMATEGVYLKALVSEGNENQVSM